MVDVIPAMSSLILSLRALTDLARGAASVRDEHKLAETVTQFQAQVLSTQDAALATQSAMLEQQGRIRELEAKLADYEGWEKEARCYELQKLPPSVYLYSLKKECAEGAPHHYLCPNCFGVRRKSILHVHGTHSGAGKHVCPACGTEYIVGAPPTLQTRAMTSDGDSWNT